MAVKLTVLAGLLAALVALASATTYTTVVTTTTSDDENPRTQSCQQEIQGMRMTHCMQYMMSGGGGYSFLRSAVANPRGGEEHLQQCCSELRQVSSPCRCDAIRRMTMELQQQYETEEEMQRMMMEKATSLPRMCGMQSLTQCSVRAVLV